MTATDGKRSKGCNYGFSHPAQALRCAARRCVRGAGATLPGRSPSTFVRRHIDVPPCIRGHPAHAESVATLARSGEMVASDLGMMAAPTSLECLQEWKILTRPNYAKLHIAKERGNCCARCSLKKGRSVVWLHLDHIVPLADGGAFTIDNMQLLCEDCHGAKTAKENSDRARARREDRAAAVPVAAAVITPVSDSVTKAAPGRIRAARRTSLTRNA